ncbi:MAG: phytanoyl-CoA dioxygenase family protein [Chloroflexota bacterium]
MKLSKEQIEFYHEEGYLLIQNLFSQPEVELLRAQLPMTYAEDSPGTVFEEGTDVVRMVHGGHKSNPVFGRLVRHPKLLTPAMQLLDDQVYVHQFKVNAKAAFAGDVWAWHQDYIFWKEEDGMPTPRTLNAAVFLDDVTEFNGPILVIPQTHKAGLHDTDEKEVALQDDDPEWMSHMTVELKYSLEQQTLARYVNQHGIVSPKGDAGSVLFFAPSIFHGSAPNMSPFDRGLALVSYNSVKNQLLEVENPRPWFLAERDFTPLDVLEGGSL